MQRVPESSSVTDEEIEAFLATRPWRGMQQPNSLEDEQGLIDMLSLPSWPPPSLNWQGIPEGNPASSSSIDHNPPRVAFAQPSTSQQAPLQARASPSSSFAAQFLSGTPEHEILLQALAEQQQRQAQLESHAQQHFISPQRRQQAHPDVQAGQSLYVQQSQQLGGRDDYASQSHLQSPITIHRPEQHSAHIPTFSVPQHAQQPQHEAHQSAATQYHLGTPTQGGWTAAGLAAGDPRFAQPRNASSPHSFESPFASPEEQKFVRYAFNPSRASQTSLHSLPEQGIPVASSSVTSSPSVEVGQGVGADALSSSMSPSSSRSLQPARRNSSEIRAIRQRRHVRQTYGGPSPISLVHSPTSSFIEGTNAALQRSSSQSQQAQAQQVRTARTSARPTSANGPQSQMTRGKFRPRTGTMSSTASFSSSQTTASHAGDDQTTFSMTLSDHDDHMRNPVASGTIPSSLSAELAGLDLQVHDTSGEEGDVAMGDDVFMQRTSSTSSSSTTKRLGDERTGEYSLFSQQTSSSSGLDDSLFSTGDPSSSLHWVHGRDTPPSSPIRPGQGRPSPSSFVAVAPQSSSMSRSNWLSMRGKSSSGEGVASSASSEHHALTWPRSTSDTSSAGARSTPSMTSSSGFIGPDGSLSRVHSPIQHSYSDNPVLASRLVPQMRLQRTASSASALSMQPLPSQGMGDGGDSSARERALHSQSPMDGFRPLGFPSTESLRSDAGPSRNVSSSASADALRSKNERKMKRWSTSVILSGPAQPSSMSKLSGGSRPRMGRASESDQYEQVSAALDTLRTFLRQRERSNQQRMSMQQQMTVDGSARARSDSHNSATSNTTKTLRHPPAGPLPPRGSVSAEHGPVAASAADRTRHQQMRHQQQTASVSPSSSFVSEASSRIGPEQSPAGGSATLSMAAPPSSSDRVAAFEGLAERLRQMGDANRRPN